MKPELILFDKPASTLSPELVGEVPNVMRGLADRGTVMVVVTHGMGFAHEVADQVVFMADGVVMGKGTPGEVLGNLKHERTRNFLFSLLK